MSIPSLHVADGIATIQLNRPKSLNALTADDYEFLSETLREVDNMPDVLCTVLQASGRAFCSGTDVGARVEIPEDTKSLRRVALSRGLLSNSDLSDALSRHSKILVALINGPAVGIAAAMLGHFDFIYAMPQAWLSVPFPFIGLTTEQNASVTFVNRMGLAKANEALLWGGRLTAEELERNGFINKIFPAEDTPSFHKAAREYLLDRLDGLDPTALLSIKRMIQTATHEKNDPRAVNMRESLAQAERFAGGVPAKRFGQLARKEIRHRL
ncbi:ClpP crotonase [Ceratobasidium sp. AG-I]|nr:ClpP crotonase [Ceratobasidium sp. AG-I]